MSNTRKTASSDSLSFGMIGSKIQGRPHQAQTEFKCLDAKSLLKEIYKEAHTLGSKNPGADVTYNVRDDLAEPEVYETARNSFIDCSDPDNPVPNKEILDLFPSNVTIIFPNILATVKGPSFG